MAITNDCIAARLLARCHNLVHTIINMETKQALKYCQLLPHPKFKDGLNLSTNNEFVHLSQGLDGCLKVPTPLSSFTNPKFTATNSKTSPTYLICLLCLQQEKRAQLHLYNHGWQSHQINPNNIGTNTAMFLLIRLFLNSVISTPCYS